MKISPIFTKTIRELASVYCDLSQTDRLYFFNHERQPFYEHQPGNFGKLDYVYREATGYHLDDKYKLVLIVDFTKAELQIQSRNIRFEVSCAHYWDIISVLLEGLLRFRLKDVDLEKYNLKPKQKTKPEDLGFLNQIEI